VNAVNCGSIAGFPADGNRQRGSVLSEEASQMSGLLEVKYSKTSWQYLVLGTDVEYSFSELMVLWFQIVHWDAIWLVQLVLGSGLDFVTSCLYQFLLFGI